MPRMTRCHGRTVDDDDGGGGAGLTYRPSGRTTLAWLPDVYVARVVGACVPGGWRAKVFRDAPKATHALPNVKLTTTRAGQWYGSRR